jgi:extracellular elastinolytic metalloproteinase
MVKEIDTRDFSYNRASTKKVKELTNWAKMVSDKLPGDHTLSIVKFNAFTGAPAMLDSRKAPPSKGSLIDEALSYVDTASEVLGFEAVELAEFVPDPHIQTTSVGLFNVYLHQYYRGIPVFQMQRTVTFSSSRELTTVSGDNAPIPSGFDIDPKINVVEAVFVAAQYVAESDDSKTVDAFGEPLPVVNIDLTEFDPNVLAVFSMSSKPTVLERGPFDDFIKAHLVLFYQGPSTRLGWMVSLTTPKHSGKYIVIVAADGTNKEILYCKNTLHTIIQGSVYETNPGESARERIDFPRPVTDYAAIALSELPGDFPYGWVDDAETVGLCTVACLADSNKSLSGVKNGADVIFDPVDPTGDDQKILNIFYFCNYMHDFFYLLGFNEGAGNFQKIDSHGQGLPDDPVLARSHRGPVFGTASMETKPDGQPPEMNMGLVASTQRHTAFDADVVFHEFTHGVTSRLVGGRMDTHSLEQPQSSGLAEGWSDYFALTVQNYGRGTEKAVTGSWVAGRRGGIRGYAYNSNFPDHFGSLGQGRYTEAHNTGEIWCATQMEMNRRVGAALGSVEKGYRLCWQIVVDSLKMIKSNPSFLEARDGVLAALDGLLSGGKLGIAEHEAVRKAIWETFAKFGMGATASCSGASLQGIKADFNIPEGI